MFREFRCDPDLGGYAIGMYMHNINSNKQVKVHLNPQKAYYGMTKHLNQGYINFHAKKDKVSY